MGAVLATVASTADDTAITDKMTKDTWIGLNLKTLTWADSSVLGSYTNWHGSNPICCSQLPESRNIKCQDATGHK